MEKRQNRPLGRMIILNIGTLLPLLGLFLLIDGLLPGNAVTQPLEGLGISTTSNLVLNGKGRYEEGTLNRGAYRVAMNDQLLVRAGGKEYHIKSPYLEQYRVADSVLIVNSRLMGFNRSIRPLGMSLEQGHDTTNGSPHWYFPLIPVILLLPIVLIFLRNRRDASIKASFMVLTPIGLYIIYRITLLMILYKDVP